MKLLRSFWLWLVAALAVLSLAVLRSPTGSSAQARIAHLESIVRCPSCQDLSVAQSNQTSSVAVRHEIETDVARGWSDAKIETTLEGVYGSSILLTPPTSGLGTLLWLVPLTVVLLVAVTWWRLRRRR